MKIKIYFILLVVLSTIMFGQTKRFFYQITFKPDAKNSMQDIGVLDVNNEKNMFYSNEYLIIDSLNTTTNRRFQFAYPKFKNIIRWTKKNDSFDFINKLSMYSYLYNTPVKLHWKLADEKKKIGNYTVQKAEVEYGGRSWTAWFSSEIPLPYGPYIFYGLPGLILEIYDSAKDYQFSFIQNKNYRTTIDSDQLMEKYLGIEQIKIAKEDWPKMQENFYNNPIPEYKNGDAIIKKDDGTFYTEKDYRELEKNVQERIKRNNNPIELNQKVQYK